MATGDRKVTAEAGFASINRILARRVPRGLATISTQSKKLRVLRTGGK